MHNDPIHLHLGFGKEQRPLIVHILEEMRAANIDIKYTIEDLEQGCVFYMKFTNPMAIYAFGHKQGSLSADPAKVMEMLSNPPEPGISKAPWTDEQVKNLKAYQECGYMHPFTCMGYNGCQRELNEGKLIPYRIGWTCPCGTYKQYWAHEFMTEPLQDDPISRLFGESPGDT